MADQTGGADSGGDEARMLGEYLAAIAVMASYPTLNMKGTKSCAEGDRSGNLVTLRLQVGLILKRMMSCGYARYVKTRA